MANASKRENKRQKTEKEPAMAPSQPGPTYENPNEDNQPGPVRLPENDK